MLDTNELKRWFDVIKNILFDVHIAYNNKRRLQQFHPTEAKIARRGFFRHHQYQLSFIIAVQLCKLFGNSRNQQHNFFALLNKLEADEYADDLLELLRENEKKKDLDEWFYCREDILSEVTTIRKELAEHSDIIDKFVYARDKLFAHEDIHRDTIVIKQQDYIALLRLASSIFNRLHGKLFRAEVNYDDTPDWDIGEILTVIVDYYRLLDEREHRKRDS